MKVKSNVKAGGEKMQHDQTVKGLRVKSMVRAGFIPGERNQHNQTVARRAR